MKKLFVVSDIHGHCTILREALDRAGFDRRDPNHILICCGDYFDRGTENMEVLQFLERLPRKILIRGNHEDMLKKLLYTGKLQPHHYINGTLTTLRSIFGKYFADPVDDTIDFSGKTRITDRFLAFIEETVDYYETEHHVFVHGWLPEYGETPLGRKMAGSEAWANARKERWDRCYNGQRPLAEKILVCGHVPTFFVHGQDESGIFYGNGIIAIDAGTAETKKINVLVLEA